MHIKSILAARHKELARELKAVCIVAELTLTDSRAEASESGLMLRARSIVLLLLSKSC